MLRQVWRTAPRARERPPTRTPRREPTATPQPCRDFPAAGKPRSPSRRAVAKRRCGLGERQWVIPARRRRHPPCRWARRAARSLQSTCRPSSAEARCRDGGAEERDAREDRRGRREVHRAGQRTDRHRPRLDEYIRGVLNRALGEDKAKFVLDRILAASDTSGIESLKWMDAATVAELIRTSIRRSWPRSWCTSRRDHAASIPTSCRSVPAATSSCASPRSTASIPTRCAN